MNLLVLAREKEDPKEKKERERDDSRLVIKQRVHDGIKVNL